MPEDPKTPKPEDEYTDDELRAILKDLEEHNVRAVVRETITEFTKGGRVVKRVTERVRAEFGYMVRKPGEDPFVAERLVFKKPKVAA